jgi:hypothetical protein
VTTEVAVKEHPILFSGPMVRAILADRKTQTRRVLNPQPDDECGWEGVEGVGYVPTIYMPEREDDLPARFAYGQVGDHLWVRESFLPDPPQTGEWDYYAYTDGVLHNFNAIPEKYRTPRHVLHKATREQQFKDLKWLPSIHMPRWASRITLEITKIDVERVQEISEEDAIAEGISDTTLSASYTGIAHKARGRCKLEYASLWNAINAKRDGGWFAWEKNPYVWVIEFKRV